MHGSGHFLTVCLFRFGHLRTSSNLCTFYTSTYEEPKTAIMPLSDCRKHKLEHVFNKFFDQNKDGSVEKSDFDAMVQKWKARREWADDSAEYKAAKEVTGMLWAGLEKLDKDGDGKVSMAEWFSLWEDSSMSGELKEWQTKYNDFMFKMHDRSGDGQVSCEEFVKIYSLYGFKEDDIKASFNKMTNNGKKVMDKPLFTQLWKEYFLSDDKSAPGNHLFCCCA